MQGMASPCATQYRSFVTILLLSLLASPSLCNCTRGELIGKSTVSERRRVLQEQGQETEKFVRFPNERFASQTGQDLWVMCWIKHPGFYMEVGAHDGKGISNTWTLDQAGWKGICADPFPTNFEQRQCKLETAVVANVTGEVIKFVKAGGHAGIADLRPEGYSTGDTVELTTISFNDLLNRNNAPSRIQYLSIDTEGSEFSIMASLDWRKYSFDVITVEHNREEPKRTDIHNLLLSKGYRLEVDVINDGWYVHERLGPLQKRGCGRLVLEHVMLDEFAKHPGFYAGYTDVLADFKDVKTIPADEILAHKLPEPASVTTNKPAAASKQAAATKKPIASAVRDSAAHEVVSTGPAAARADRVTVGLAYAAGFVSALVGVVIIKALNRRSSKRAMGKH